MQGDGKSTILAAALPDAGSPGRLCLDIREHYQGIHFQVTEAAMQENWGWLVSEVSVTRLPALPPRSMAEAIEAIPRFDLSVASGVSDSHILWPQPETESSKGADSAHAKVGESDSMEDIVKQLRASAASHLDLAGLEEAGADGLDSEVAELEIDSIVQSLKEALPKKKNAAAKAKVKVVRVRMAARKTARKRPASKISDDLPEVQGAAGSGGSGEVLPPEGVVPPPPAPDEAAPARVRARAPQAAGRQMVAEPWGEFSISPVFSNKTGERVQIGWGANCLKHKNGPGCSLRCQKQVPFTAADGGADEARRLCKVWLLCGRRLDSTHPTGQHEHVHQIGKRWRVAAPPITEAEADIMVLTPGLAP